MEAKKITAAALRLNLKARARLASLLLNSLEAMPQGGKLEVTTSAGQDGLSLRITDTGIGVAPDQQKHVWDPFFTTKERGMGLGLAIVKGVVERHGGQITLTSRPGQGTTIEVNLPRHCVSHGDGVT